MSETPKDQNLRLSWKPYFQFDVECDDSDTLFRKANAIRDRLNATTPYKWEISGGVVTTDYFRTWYSLVIKTRDLTLPAFDDALLEVNQEAA